MREKNPRSGKVIAYKLRAVQFTFVALYCALFTFAVKKRRRLRPNREEKMFMFNLTSIDPACMPGNIFFMFSIKNLLVFINNVFNWRNCPSIRGFALPFVRFKKEENHLQRKREYLFFLVFLSFTKKMQLASIEEKNKSNLRKRKVALYFNEH